MSAREIKDGVVWKNSKLYRFSRREGILVVKGWPDLVAYRKTPKGRAFFSCRADICLGPKPDVGRCQRKQLPRTVESVRLHEEVFGAHREIIPEANIVDVEEEARRKWMAERRAKDEAALQSFAETFPVDYRRVLARFGSRQWQLARLCKLEGGLEMINSNPGLAFAIANSWVFRMNSQPTRTARRLLRIPRRKAAAWLGFPDSERTVKLLGKVDPAACYIYLILNLRRGIPGEMGRVLGFLPRLNVDALSLASSGAARAIATPRLLRDVVKRAEDPGCLGEWHELLMDSRRMLRRLGTLEELKPVFSVRGLKRLHDRISGAYTERFGDEALADPVDPAEDLVTPLPPPPIPGTPAIIPLTTAQDILDEATRMKHCVLSLLEDVRKGRCYIYHVASPESATLEVSSSGRSWKLAQLKGPSNRRVQPETLAAVRAWFNSTGAAPG